ncbi:putative acetyltransferase [Actinopolymorpha cephalotaxi]|uniref:Acetyltransferase n=1 Tax=Actinopolymorpha cephalotaxi TaxID=504797 RepID=A0A1I3BBW9_9ACTN|nr:N-acetyltransferase [Actinopolymorpha cephalotaxi]NYH86780.1 putative acetyltransferase [Actinopolymorpha cephalotaxi]SFH59596.1 putative acetyltransferase [Actinopolymorpha cephalotaxi]
MLIRRETAADVPAVGAVTGAAFAKPDTPAPVEVRILDGLRASPAWLPPLSLVAIGAQEEVLGHAVCTRGYVGAVPALGLGPISVHPDHQRRGVGLALMHALLGAADAVGEPFVALVGNPVYYGRYGFSTGTDFGIAPPDPAWGEAFQVRTLTAYEPTVRGTFTFAEAFDVA